LKLFRSILIILGITLIVSACAPSQAETVNTPDWFAMELIDVQTGESFNMNDYAGKVVLLETMGAPTALFKQTK
jgi:hypothetical protein